MIATVSLRDSSASVTPPAGWTLLTSLATPGSTSIQYVYSKVATASEGASYTFSWIGGSGATDSSGVILAYSGIWAGAGSNIDTSTTATASATTTATTAAGTAAYAQDMLLALYGTAGDSGFTTPTGMTARASFSSQSGAPGVRSASGTFDVIQAASGAIGAKSSTITSRDWTAVLVAIRPAAATASASLSTLAASPASVLADGTTTSTVTGTIRDSNGNALPGKTVTLAKSGGSSTITTVSGTTDAAGQATFAVKDSVVESSTYTATDTTDSMTITQTAAVSFTVGPASAAQSTVSASPASVTANGVATSTVTVTLMDAQSHLLLGKTVTLAKSGGSSTITTVSGVDERVGSGDVHRQGRGRRGGHLHGHGHHRLRHRHADRHGNVHGRPGDGGTVDRVGFPHVCRGQRLDDGDSHRDPQGRAVQPGRRQERDAGEVGRLLDDHHRLRCDQRLRPGDLHGQGRGGRVDHLHRHRQHRHDHAHPDGDGDLHRRSGDGGAVDGRRLAGLRARERRCDLDRDGHVERRTVASRFGQDGDAGEVGWFLDGHDGLGHDECLRPGDVQRHGHGRGGDDLYGDGHDGFGDGDADGGCFVHGRSGDAGAVDGVGFPLVGRRRRLDHGDADRDVRDAQSNPVSGKTVALAKSGGSSTITTVSGTSNASGQASFTVKDTVAEATTYTATDTTDSVTVTQTAAVTFTAGPVTAAQSTVSAAPGSVTANGVATSTVTVTLKDALSNPVSGKTVTLTKSGGSSTITTISGVTNGSGVASFTVTDTVAESATYTATDTTDSVTVSQTATVTFTAGPVTAAQSTVTASPTSVTADGATAATVTVTLRDAQSNPVSGKTVTLAKSGGSSTITTLSGTTNASGVATFTVKDAAVESTTYTATDTTDTLTVTQTAVVSFTAGAVDSTSSTVSAAPSSVVANGAASSTITVTAKDAFAHPLAGQTVTLAQGAGSLHDHRRLRHHQRLRGRRPSPSPTPSPRPSPTPQRSASPRSCKPPPSPTPPAPPPTSPSPPQPPAAAGSPFSVTLTALDANNNTATAYTGTVHFTSNDGQAMLPANYTFLAGDNGSHTFNNTTTLKTAGSKTVAATDTLTGSITASTSLTVNPAAANAATSTLTATPSSIVADGSTTSTITATITDPYNNPLTGKTITLSKGSGSSTITTLSATTNAAGQATFTTTNTVAETTTYTATDTTDTLTITQTATVTYTAGTVSPTQSTINASPTSITADGTTTSTITVTANDTFGNPVGGQAVALAQGAGSSTITTLSGTTNASGQATFTVTNTTSQSVTYSATIGATGVLQTATVVFTDGVPTAAQSTVSASPASVVADGSTTSTVTVTLRDSNSNTVAGKTVTLVKAGGSSTITTVSGTTNASGQATFTVKDTVAEATTYTATDATDSVTVTQTATVTFTPGSVTAAQSSVSASPGSLIADGATTSAVTVTLRDAQSNPVAGKTVTLTKSGGSSTITTISGVTNGSGVASFTVTDTVAESATYTATDTTDSVTVTQTATVTFVAGAVSAAQSSVSASPTSVAANGSSTSIVTVTLRDANGNAVAGKTVSLAAGSGSSVVATLSATTSAAGEATFAVSDATAETVSYTATDTPDAVTVTQTVSVSFAAGAVSAGQSTLVAAPGSATADGTSASILTATLRDSNGNPVPGKSVTLTKGAGSSTIATLSGTTDAAGHATFSVADTVAETTVYTAHDTADSLTVTQTATVTFVAGPVSVAQSSVSASPASIVADGSSSSTVTVTLRDAQGNPISGKSVTLAKSGGSSTITTVAGTTNSSGVATFSVHNTAAEMTAYTATDSTDGATVTQTASVTFTAGGVSSAQSTVSATPGSVAADGSTTATLTVTALDTFGNPVATQPVSLAQASGSSTITAVSGTTNTSGVATFTAWSTVAETVTYNATIGVTGVLQTAAVTFTPGPATHFTVSAPASVTAGGAGSLTVTALDAQGNVATGYTGAVAFSSSDPQATLPGAYTFTGADHGSHTLSVTLKTAGTQTVTADDGTAAGTSSPVTVTAAGADAGASTLAASPSSIVADDSTTATLTATITDAYGNPLPGKTVSLARSGGSSTITTVAGTTNAAGQATFNARNSVAETTTYTATDSTDSVTVGQSAVVTFAAGAVSAVQSAVSAAPGSVTADGTSSATVTVTARDAFGNPVPAQVVTLGQGAGSSAVTTVSGTTNPSGNATFTVSSTTAETVTYTVSIGATAILQTAQVVYTPGPPAQLAFDQQPSDTLSGATIAPAITVRVLDAHNNLTASATSVALTIKSGTGAAGATLAGTATRTTVAGIATFNDLSIAKAASGYRLTAQSAGITASDSVTFDETVGPIAPGRTTISAAPSTIDADGSSSSSITVRARDANDNDVAGGGATIALASTLGTLGSVADNGDGTYSATLTAGLTSGSAQVTGTINGSAIGHAATVTIQPQQTSVVIDGGAPAAQTQATGFTVGFHSDDASAAFECSLDGEPFAACFSPTTRSGLADGPHTLRIHAVNGNATNPNATLAWTVDTQAPTVAFTTSPGAYTKNATEALAASAADATTAIAGVTFRYAANAGACPSGTLISTETTPPYATTWTTPSDGSYVVCAIATDSVGETAQANASVLVDQTPPAGTFPAVGTSVGSDRYVRGSVALHATATDAASLVDHVEFLGDAGSLATVPVSPYDATWNSTGDGPSTLSAVISDRAGNSTTLSQPVIRDNTAPTAALDDPGQWGHGTIALSITASDLGSGIDTAGIVIGRSTDGGNSWSPIGLPATWTPASGTYQLRAVVPDRVGNSTTTAVRTIVVDNTAPTASDSADTNWHNSPVTVSLSAADLESGVALPAGMEYKVDGGSFTTGTSVVVPAPANGSNDGTHTITYRATNRAGVTSADQTATVKIDATAPGNVTLDTPGSAGLLHGSVPLAATTQDATSGIASTTFRLVPGTLGAASCATSGSVVSSPVDTTTLSDGHYDMWVAAVDAAGNGRCSVTPHDVVIDNTRPVTTDNAPAGAQNHDVTVNLVATDNLSGVGSTEYSLDGGSNWTTGTSVTILASNGDGPTTITYRSHDLAGNVEVAKSTTVTIDTTAPAGGVNDPGSVLHGTVSLTASPSDPDVASVGFLYRPAGPGAYTPIATDTTAPYDVPWITTGPATPDGLYDLEIIVTDTAGNATTVALSTKTIDNTAPDTATVTMPAAAANVGGSSISLAANASDVTSGVASVAFEVKPTGASSFTTVDADTNGVPFTGAWSPAPGTPDGPVDVRVAATDVAGNGPTYSAVVTFTLDRTDPVVSLSAPTPVAASAALGATGSADIDHVVYAYSGDGGSSWTPISTGNGPAPYGVNWATPLSDGSYQVRATAIDGGGNQGTDVQTVQVDRTAPSGGLTQPAAAATVGGAAVSIAATATDPGGSGLASVSFRYRPAGGGAFTALATDTAAPFTATWDVTSLPSGGYELQADLLDNAGNTRVDARTVTVDSTPPTPSAISIAALIRGHAPISVATSGDTTTATYAFDLSGGAVTWIQVGSSTSSPAFGATVDTTALADGVYDVRAVVVDQFGNAATILDPNVRVDNTAPSVVSSTPADGSVAASAGPLALTASEDVASITQLELDGAATAFAPTLAGPTASFPTGALTNGNHSLTGWLHDAVGNSSPFRLNVTVEDGTSTEQPETTKNVSSSLPTILSSVDGAITVTTPANVWQGALPQAQDFLVLHVDPSPDPASIPPTTIQLGASIAEVRMSWDLAGTDEHQFDAPVQIDLNDSTNGVGTPVTAEPGAAWGAIPQLSSPGTLPAAWQDGYWRTGNVVHILTRHLSLFAILTGVVSNASAAPRGFTAVVADDGLTLRWAPGIPHVRTFVLYATGCRSRSSTASSSRPSSGGSKPATRAGSR